MSPPERKKRRTDDYSFAELRPLAADVRSRRSAFLESLERGVSPPAGRQVPPLEKTEQEMTIPGRVKDDAYKSSLPSERSRRKITGSSNPRIISSPFKLTSIRDLPDSDNVDTIGIKDILGDVMLKEVWLFDFLYDVDWVMQQFDADVRHLVSIVLVHGSWRREDPNKIHIDEASKRYSNVKVVTAYMPEVYGCHHSKSMVLFRHDDLAQVIVHTANMIEQDWRNLTQGVWSSPMLPLQALNGVKSSSKSVSAIGTGARFKHDFMAYLRYYGNRTGSLVSQLDKFDFSAITAALIAHVPAKFDGKETEPTAQLWGWPALKRALGSIAVYDALPAADMEEREAPHIVCQVSSIASLTEKWFRETLFPTVSHTSTPPPTPLSKTSQQFKAPSTPKPRFSIIFPTASEVRTSLDGYASGGSIHCKLQSAAQRKQFNFMKSYLCHWNPPSPQPPPRITQANSQIPSRALRGPAAPHIKTFIRFNDTSTHASIDWALLTSANLSTQAWGTEANAKSGEVRISSYELGVLVWPNLFLQDTGHEDGQREKGVKDRGGRATGRGRKRAIMIPAFGSDKPTATQVENALLVRTNKQQQQQQKQAKDETHDPEETESDPEPVTDNTTIIGLRMPYDLPPTSYGPNDEVWSARGSYAELDGFGRAWNVGA